MQVDYTKALSEFAQAFLDVANSVDDDNYRELLKKLKQASYVLCLDSCSACLLAGYWLSFPKLPNNPSALCHQTDNPYYRVWYKPENPKQVRDCCLSIVVACDQQLAVLKTEYMKEM
jgi:hypothetical protein